MFFGFIQAYFGEVTSAFLGNYGYGQNFNSGYIGSQSNEIGSGGLLDCFFKSRSWVSIFMLEIGSLHSHFIFQDLFQGDRYIQATTLVTNYYQWDSCSMTQAASESLGKIG